MTELAMCAKTYLPDDREVLDELVALGGEQCYLVGPQGRIKLPTRMHEVLMHVVAAMHEGRAVTITPQDALLTTQQAADLLGLSRPTVVKLVDSGELPATRPSTRRLIRLEDVLAYGRERRHRQLDLIAESSVALDSDADEARLAERLADARRSRHECRVRSSSRSLSPGAARGVTGRSASSRR